jgi:hypothetical protein
LIFGIFKENFKLHPSVEFGEEIRTRTKVMVFQTFGGEMWGKYEGKASDNRKSGRKYRAKLIFTWYNIGFLLMWTMKFGLEIRTRTKVMVFLTIGGNVGGNVGKKLLT